MPTLAPEPPKLSIQRPMRAALRSIHLLVVRARLLALDWKEGRTPVDPQKMVDYLDAIEILPDILKRGDHNAFEEFRAMLLAIGKDHPEFAGLIVNFDREVAGEPPFDGPIG